MERTHVVTFYRKGASTGRTASMRPVKAWASQAADIPSNLQALANQWRDEPDGKRVQVAALLLCHPSDYPDGFTPTQGDGVVVTSGPTSRSTFLVHGYFPFGGDGPFDDELELVNTEVSIP